MAWFRRRTGLSFDLLDGGKRTPPPSLAEPVFRAEVRGTRWIAPRSSPGDVAFYVSGTGYRQDALARVGSGQRLFRLLRQPDNPHDPDAVMVLADGVHIGFVTAKNAGRYGRMIGPVEAAGYEVFVHGQIRRNANQHSSKWVAMIDCAYPNDWPEP